MKGAFRAFSSSHLLVAAGFILIGGAFAYCLSKEPAGSTLKTGQPAPAFTLPAANGSAVSLKEYIGRSKVVLVFYRGYW